jgi:hypothetical protein
MKMNKSWIVPERASYPDYIVQILSEINVLLKQHNIEDKIKHKNKSVTVGQYIIYRAAEIVDLKDTEVAKLFPLTKKRVGTLLTLAYDKAENERASWFYWLIQYVGFLFSTKRPSSYTDETYQIPDKILKQRNKIVDEFKSGKIDDITFDNKMSELSKVLIQHYKDKDIPVSDIIESGSAKNDVENIKRMFLSRGLSIDASGHINTVVTEPYSEGLSPEHYILSASEAITSQYSKSVLTADPGYLARQLNDLLSGVFISKEKDCKTKQCLEIKITDKVFASSYIDRYLCNGQLISSPPKVGSVIKVRSPLYCKATDGICHKCLGEIFFKQGFNSGDSLLVVGTSIAGSLTDISLKQAHTGTSLNKEHVDFLKELK